MRPRTCLLLGLAVVLFALTGLAQGQGRTVPHAGKASSAGQPSRDSSPGYHQSREWSHARSPRFNRGFGSSGYGPYSGYTYAPYGFQSYGWPYFGAGYYRSPHMYGPRYSYSDDFPYVYFFDLYSREAQSSKEEADRFEASFAGRGPARAAGDAAPLSPRDVLVSLDGQVLAPSASGTPVVLESGQHTLRIAAKPAANAPSTRAD